MHHSYRSDDAETRFLNSLQREKTKKEKRQRQLAEEAEVPIQDQILHEFSSSGHMIRRPSSRSRGQGSRRSNSRARSATPRRSHSRTSYV
jgi:hypothetical protein